MSLTELLALAVAALAAENLFFTRFLGAGSLLRGWSGVAQSAAAGGTVTLVMVLCAPLTWAVGSLVLRPLGLDYLELVAFLLLIALVEWVLRLIAGRLGPLKPMTELLPLAAVNSAVLGGALLASRELLGLAEGLLTAFLGGLGFTLAAVLLASVRGRLTFSRCPKAFEGVPIALVTAGLLAMAFIGFAGVKV